jgi:hypothetical protein
MKFVGFLDASRRFAFLAVSLLSICTSGTAFSEELAKNPPEPRLPFVTNEDLGLVVKDIRADKELVVTTYGTEDQTLDNECPETGSGGNFVTSMLNARGIWTVCGDCAPGATPQPPLCAGARPTCCAQTKASCTKLISPHCNSCCITACANELIPGINCVANCQSRC